MDVVLVEGLSKKVGEVSARVKFHTGEFKFVAKTTHFLAYYDVGVGLWFFAVDAPFGVVCIYNHALDFVGFAFEFLFKILNNGSCVVVFVEDFTTHDVGAGDYIVDFFHFDTLTVDVVGNYLARGAVDPFGTFNNLGGRTDFTEVGGDSLGSVDIEYFGNVFYRHGAFATFVALKVAKMFVGNVFFVRIV